MALSAAEWIPENPLGIHLPFQSSEDFARFEPKADFAQFGARIASSFLSEADEVKVGLYGWVIYGVLIMIHWSYYADHYYWNYT